MPRTRSTRRSAKDSRMKKLYERLCAAEAFTAAAVLPLMGVLIVAGGVARLLAHPLNWTIDAATALFAWAVFLCADIAWRKNSHMSIELLTKRLPARLQSACRLPNCFIISAFLLYAMVMGVWLPRVSRGRAFPGLPQESHSCVRRRMPG